MIETTVHQALCGHFATLLSYPSEPLSERTAACMELLNQVSPQAETSLAQFGAFVAANQTSRVEEVFTATFDLQPACFPYVGYQLCGEGQQRALFLMELQQVYRRHGFEANGELPDHLGTVLRFLEVLNDADFRQEIVADGLLPALDKILQGLDSDGHPYAHLMRALQVFLAGTLEPGTENSADDSRNVPAEGVLP